MNSSDYVYFSPTNYNNNYGDSSIDTDAIRSIIVDECDHNDVPGNFNSIKPEEDIQHKGGPDNSQLLQSPTQTGSFFFHFAIRTADGRFNELNLQRNETDTLESLPEHIACLQNGGFLVDAVSITATRSTQIQHVPTNLQDNVMVDTTPKPRARKVKGKRGEYKKKKAILKAGAKP